MSHMILKVRSTSRGQVCSLQTRGVARMQHARPLTSKLPNTSQRLEQHQATGPRLGAVTHNKPTPWINSPQVQAHKIEHHVHYWQWIQITHMGLRRAEQETLATRGRRLLCPVRWGCRTRPQQSRNYTNRKRCQRFL